MDDFLLTSLCFCFIDNDDTLKLHLQDLALEFSWPIGRIKEALSKLSIPESSTPASCTIEATKSIAALVEEQTIPEAKIFLASGVSAFLWLYTSIQGYESIVFVCAVVKNLYSFEI